MIHHDGGNTLKTIIKSLEGLGYHTKWQLLNANSFGVAQNRERVIILGTKNKSFDFLNIKQHASLSTLNDILDTNADFEYLDPSEYTLLESPKMQALGLIFAGFRSKAIRKAGVREGTLHLFRVHKQPNRIYSAKGLHPTLPSQESSGRFFILLDDGRVRKLTINECFKLIGYPASYKRPSSLAKQYRQIGNSVCVPMIKAIAEQVLNEHLN